MIVATCTTCGGTNVSVQVWLRSGVVEEIIEDAFCHDCDDDVQATVSEDEPAVGPEATALEACAAWQARFDELASGIVPFADDRIDVLRAAVRDGVTNIGKGGAEAVAALLGRVEQARADALIAYELREQLINKRNALQAKLADLGVGLDDVDVRAHTEREAGNECRAEEYQLRWCENRLAQALGIDVHEGWEALIASVVAVKAERVTAHEPVVGPEATALERLRAACAACSADSPVGFEARRRAVCEAMAAVAAEFGLADRAAELEQDARTLFGPAMIAEAHALDLRVRRPETTPPLGAIVRGIGHYWLILTVRGRHVLELAFDEAEGAQAAAARFEATGVSADEMLAAMLVDMRVDEHRPETIPQRWRHVALELADLIEEHGADNGFYVRDDFGCRPRHCYEFGKWLTTEGRVLELAGQRVRVAYLRGRFTTEPVSEVQP